jgi:hypothetical protein
MLNIITTKENAANIEISGIIRVASRRLMRLKAEYHPGAANA